VRTSSVSRNPPNLIGLGTRAISAQTRVANSVFGLEPAPRCFKWVGIAMAPVRPRGGKGRSHRAANDDLRSPRQPCRKLRGAFIPEIGGVRTKR